MISKALSFLLRAKWAIAFIVLSRYVIPEPFWVASSIVVLTITFAHNYRGLILQLSPFLFIAGLSSNGAYFSNLSKVYGYNVFYGILISTLGFFAFCFTLHLFDRYIKRFQIIILTSILGFCLFFNEHIESGNIKFAVTSFIFFLQSGFWYFVLSYGEKDIVSSGVFFTRFNLSHVVSHIPIPPQFLKENESKNIEELTRCQKNSVYSIASVILLRFLYRVGIKYFSLSENLFGELFHLNYLNPQVRGFFESLLQYYSDYGTAGKWFTIYTMSFLIIINTIAFSCVAVAYYQCLGFNIPYFVKPMSSVKYYHEFFGALYRYYNKALVSIFYQRFFQQLSFLRRKYRSIGAVFFTIFIGGWFFSVEKEVIKSGQELGVFLVHASYGLGYFFILAILCCVSLIFQKKEKKQYARQISVLSSISRIIIYFLIFGFLLSFRLLINYKEMNLNEVFKVFKSLFI